MLPLAPLVSVAVMTVSDKTLKDAAGVPPKLTAEAPEKLRPLNVTVFPKVAESGVEAAITGRTSPDADAGMACGYYG